MFSEIFRHSCKIFFSPCAAGRRAFDSALDLRLNARAQRGEGALATRLLFVRPTPALASKMVLLAQQVNLALPVVERPLPRGQLGVLGQFLARIHLRQRAHRARQGQRSPSEFERDHRNSK